MQVCNKILPDLLKSDINHKIDMIADSLFAEICCVKIGNKYDFPFINIR